MIAATMLHILFPNNVIQPRPVAMVTARGERKPESCVLPSIRMIREPQVSDVQGGLKEQGLYEDDY